MAEVHCLLNAGIRLTVIGGKDTSGGHFFLRAGPNDVPDDFWKEWVSENEEFGPYKAGLIFIHKDPENEAPKPKAAPYRKGK